ncbi:uncharacterized protein EI90DRAFT_3279412 [Cantharellus anzutake]|uniref:uncharacterized protein n=1 Tax=Cantharellus anzutake TaxID=1750568 RepID=UPI001908D095|nr:uncharacterized protein EI90DRAFT_3279412 [Cantharellus anzutake]KAF8338840.1 hypothetical protein EI90DRAFT_3279412 [Cantharellus anzutake]
MAERVRGVVIHRPIIYGNSAYPLTTAERNPSIPSDHTHRWTVAVRSPVTTNEKSDIVGGADDLGYFIKRVTFRLHETYPQPNRNIDKSPFEVTETGWGEFDISIRILFISESGEKTLTLQHHLKLHPWVVPDLAAHPGQDPALIIPPVTQPPPEPVHSWQYDEIVFTDPLKPFLDILMAHPPTQWPKMKRRAIPPNPAHPDSLAPPAQRGAPEFTQVIERDEAERLDAAKRKLVEEAERLRAALIEKEKELARLRKEVEA